MIDDGHAQATEKGEQGAGGPTEEGEDGQKDIIDKPQPTGLSGEEDHGISTQVTSVAATAQEEKSDTSPPEDHKPLQEQTDDLIAGAPKGHTQGVDVDEASSGKEDRPGVDEEKGDRAAGYEETQKPSKKKHEKGDHEKESHIPNLDTKLRDRAESDCKTRIDTLQGQNHGQEEDLQDKIRNPEAKLSEGQKHRRSLEDTATQQMKLHCDLEDELAKAKNQAEADLKKCHEERKAEVKRKDDRIADLGAELEDCKGRQEDISKEVGARDERIARLETELNKARNDLEECHRDKEGIKGIVETITIKCSDIASLTSDSSPTTPREGAVATSETPARQPSDSRHGRHHEVSCSSARRPWVTLLAVAALLAAAVDGVLASQRFSQAYGFYYHGGFDGLTHVFVFRTWWQVTAFILATSYLASGLAGAEDGVRLWMARRRLVMAGRRRRE